MRDHPDASAILLRSYDPRGPRWDADVLEEIGAIPSDFAEFILGTRRKILFVEGDATSLDTRLYSNLFPTASIIPVATCSAVERHVKALRSAVSHHWTEAYGLIDGDNRDPIEIADLAHNHIAALSYYSVESLYYHPKVIEQLALRQCRVTGGDASQLARDAVDSAIKAATTARDSFVAKSTSRRIRDLALRSCPSPNEVAAAPDGEVCVQVRPMLDQERASFDALLAAADYEGLITKYPVRESSAFSAIEKVLRFSKRGLYRSAVRLLVDQDIDTRTELLKAAGQIDAWLNG